MNTYHAVMAVLVVVSLASLATLCVVLWRYEGDYENGRWR